MKNSLYMQRDYSWNPSTWICGNSKYFKSTADTSVTECDEVIVFMDNVSRKKSKYYSNKCYGCCFDKFS